MTGFHQVEDITHRYYHVELHSCYYDQIYSNFVHATLKQVNIIRIENAHYQSEMRIEHILHPKLLYFIKWLMVVWIM